MSGRTFGPGAQIAVGVAPARNLQLGIEALLWSRLIADDGAVGRLSAVSLLAAYFPMDTSGLFLRGGVGAEQYDGGGRQRAMAFQLGVGYEIHSSSALIGSPFVGYLRSVGGRQKVRRMALVDGQAMAITETRKVDASLIRVGVEWQWGARRSGAVR
ncbi:MAG: hypothetical protein M3068_09205 [Gemmatimonadota bacterium]|nr:hypothetical protein [Gemmatimonadota bacterium]